MDNSVGAPLDTSGELGVHPGVIKESLTEFTGVPPLTVSMSPMASEETFPATAWYLRISARSAGTASRSVAHIIREGRVNWSKDDQ